MDEWSVTLCFSLIQKIEQFAARKVNMQDTFCKIVVAAVVVVVVVVCLFFFIFLFFI